MKVAALLFIVLSILMLVGFGFMYVLGFAMSFDAPGSAHDPKAWGMRLVMFLPFLVLLVAIILAVMAFASGNFKKSFIISLVPVGIFGLLVLYLFISSFTSLAKYRTQIARESREALMYPKQKFLRPVEGGVDTIIVFPSRIVAYRKYQGLLNPWSGPLGDLNETRDTLYYLSRTDTKIAMSELDQFFNDEGQKFTEMYAVTDKQKK